MRSEPEVLQALLGWALEGDNTRAIVLDGSRADPTRTIDEHSDFDVIVIVNDLEPIRAGAWISRFGQPMVRWPLQPEPTFDDAWTTQLVLYTDGLRIDFQFTTPDVQEIEQPGPFHCVLFDRDRLTQQLRGHPVEGTTITSPKEAEFIDRVNAFWWDIPYVAKALSRGELDYARFVLEGDLRFNKLHPLIRWHVGAVHGADTDVGVCGRWFRRYLDVEVWSRYLETFSGADPGDHWRAMFAMCAFVRMIGRDVARRYGFQYPEETDEKVTEYLRRLRDH